MTRQKSSSQKKPADSPGGGALRRTRQFAASRGLPPPTIGDDTPAPQPATKKNTKRAAKR
jgi:hypothetical protein